VKRVCHQRKRVDGISSDKLDEEKYGIDCQEDGDPRRLGEAHLRLPLPLQEPGGDVLVVGPIYNSQNGGKSKGGLSGLWVDDLYD